ncbi:hypothetical protein [Nonomuraea lactucae]|uniref:hypothetical protein n=1 Tax=Nonomuraea lactucae TaxID=2249762 RepID=UPI000DE2E09A|nr:hypothetical protein [Nonomuraea lactucae]
MLALPRNTAFVVVMPDAMAQDLWGALATRMGPLRLQVLAASSLVLRPPLLSALYAHGTFKQPRPGRATSSWLSHAAAELDSSVAAVVRTPFDVDLPGLLDAWKGPSTFGRRRPGDLRSVAPAAHRCHSVLHTPDNAEQAAKDVVALLGEETLEEVVSSDAPERCRFDRLRRLRMPSELRAAPHPYDVVIRCLVRAAAVLAYDHATVPSREWTEFADLTERVRDELGVVPPGSVADAWWSAASMLAVRLPSPPRPAPGPPRGRAGALPELHGVLRRLLAPERYDAVTGLAVESAFHTHDLFLNPWERHTLRIALSFPVG